jgi:hypothetical protein
MKTSNKKREMDRNKALRIKIRGPEYPIGL